GLHGEHQAGAHRLVIDDDSAGAADAVLAADMGAGLAAIIADGVDQGFARLNPRRIVAAVDIERNVGFFVHCTTLVTRRRIFRARDLPPLGWRAPRWGTCRGA